MTDTSSFLSFDEVARLLGLETRRIKQLLKERRLFCVRDDAGEDKIPAEIIVKGENGWEPLFSLPGTLTLLADDGFTPQEAVDWLYRVQDELGETPLEALVAGRHHRVNAIASTLAF
ncbi:Rv2175c family DNA-binding protein [Actinomyces sp. B33]|uniref:Rv2175c family DNA-binding protein n=1 Tax=Actinomyces sp. B33 TaxID=2942131 RepID=UPI00233FB8B8|nr:Rv2175c family DNA-binding protein [Actinomyces sp. B33]MDC4232942.1 Rv2175c family DNA-binding protein [Actinomyces sp. B33]